MSPLAETAPAPVLGITGLAVEFLGVRALDGATDHVLTNYMRHPGYWGVDDRAYFSIYDIGILQIGLGGRLATRAALDDLRARAKRAGVGELHLNVVVNQWMTDVNAMVAELGFDSVTHCTWIHHEYELKIVAINAWNEWTEGSYLEPDVEHGMAYLDALRSVSRTKAGSRR